MKEKRERNSEEIVREKEGLKEKRERETVRR